MMLCRKKKPYDKFNNIYYGPYIVTNVNVIIYIKKRNAERTVHKNRLRKKI